MHGLNLLFAFCASVIQCLILLFDQTDLAFDLLIPLLMGLLLTLLVLLLELADLG